jgi:fructose-1,6-bisphosphatase/inositol monophosphatase family enzyme
VIDDARVPRLLQEAADRVVMPRWRRLADGDVRVKDESDPDDLVTVADVEAEEMIAEGLGRIRPDAVVVGEEATAADPSLLERLGDLPAYWLIDPIDGTGNFVAGSPDFGVMVALVEGGVASAGWIWLPVTRRLAVAQRGAGTRLDGVVVDVVAGPERDLDQMRGWIAATYLPVDVRERIRAEARGLCTQPAPMSAAVGYVRLLEGRSDVAFFWRSYPWDHVPGALLLAEAGGAALRLDRTGYDPADGGTGLLAARDRRTWTRLRALLFGNDEI